MCLPAYHDLMMYEEYVHTYIHAKAPQKKRPKYGWNL
jgi:hypothetical protein